MTTALGSLYGQVTFCSYSFAPESLVTPFDFMTGRSDFPYLGQGRLAYNEMLNRANTHSAQSNDCYLVMSVNFTYSFNGNEIQTGTTENKNMLYSAGSLTSYVVVTNVELDETHIYL